MLEMRLTAWSNDRCLLYIFTRKKRRHLMASRFFLKSTVENVIWGCSLNNLVCMKLSINLQVEPPLELNPLIGISETRGDYSDLGASIFLRNACEQETNRLSSVNLYVVFRQFPYISQPYWNWAFSMGFEALTATFLWGSETDQIYKTHKKGY